MILHIFLPKESKKAAKIQDGHQILRKLCYNGKCCTALNICRTNAKLNL